MGLKAACTVFLDSINAKAVPIFTVLTCWAKCELDILLPL